MAALVRDRLGRETELVEITTEGDLSQAAGTPLAGSSTTGVFVNALREALLDGRIDVAVHSLKDLPTMPADGIALAAVPQREDPRDVVVARDGLTLGELPAGSRVGTGSPRRAGTAARPRPRFGRGRGSWERRHQDREGPVGGVRRSRACSGGAGPDRSTR